MKKRYYPYKKFYCPVPEEQLPLNEYLNLKNSLIFWPIISLERYIIKLKFFNVFIFFFSIPIANNFYSFLEFPSKFLFLNYLIILVSNFLLLIKSYLGGIYIKERLNTSFVKYEESGWYDCKIWIKSVEVLKQDRLISYYKVLPVLNRLKQIIIYYTITFFILFNLFIYL
jgi:hypothetical protein